MGQINRMRVLGIDYGEKRIGLAVSDRLLLTSQALGQYNIKNKKEDKRYFKALVSRYEINEIVIGLPLMMDGSAGTQAEKTKEFAAWMESALKLPVILWDERLTTKQAVQILRHQKLNTRKQKGLKDQVSAAIILSSYLESKREKAHGSQKH